MAHLTEAGSERARQEGQQAAAPQHDDEGWIYSGAFPLMHADAVLIPAPARSRPEPLDFVRWRRWIRRRRLRTVERRVVRVESSAQVPGDRVGDVDVRSVPSSSLAICNLSTHRLYVGVYLPVDEAHDGGTTMVLREGEVIGLGINAICRALDVKGKSCVLVAARRSGTLPPLLTADVTARLCVVVPESLFKRVYLAVAEPDDDGIRSLACAHGNDGVVAFNALQRELYVKAKPYVLQRLELHAKARSKHRWAQDAAVRLQGLSQAELRYVHQRRCSIRADLSLLLAQDVAEDEVPCICLCMGGGGVRAMIYALGALRALSRLGVLPVVTYSAALSGSAWMQALWMSMAGRAHESLDSLADWLSLVLEQHPIAQAVAGPTAVTAAHEHLTPPNLHDPPRPTAADAADVTSAAKETLLRLDRQRAAAEAFATALQHRAAWSGKSPSLVEFYGFLAANAWLPVSHEREASGSRHSDRLPGGDTHPGAETLGEGGRGEGKVAGHERAGEEVLLERLERGLSAQVPQKSPTKDN